MTEREARKLKLGDRVAWGSADDHMDLGTVVNVNPTCITVEWDESLPRHSYVHPAGMDDYSKMTKAQAVTS